MRSSARWTRTWTAPGGLSSLALRLSAERRDTIEGQRPDRARPAELDQEDTHRPSRRRDRGPDAGVSAAVGVHGGGQDAQAGRHRQHPGPLQNEMELLVRRLILISVAPPTSRNYDAQILLGMLASYAFEPDEGPPGLPAAGLADGVPGVAGDHQAGHARRGRRATER